MKDELTPRRGWLSPSDIRISPPPSSDRGVVFRCLSVVARWFRRPELPHLFPVMNIHRRLFWPWLLFASQMMPFGGLPARLRELLILRVGWCMRCRYEWGQHLEIALDEGVSDRAILEVSSDSPSFDDPLVDTAIEACDELLETGIIKEGTWAELSSFFSQREILEMMLLVGHYRMVAGVLLNSGIQLEERIEQVVVAFNQRIAELVE